MASERPATDCHRCGTPAPIDTAAARALIQPAPHSSVMVTGIVCPSCGADCALVFTAAGISRMARANEATDKGSPS
jgi:hypothetical protein